MSKPPVKRSVVIFGHKTSISLEDEFWTALKLVAEARKIPVSQLVETLEAERGPNLSSTIRVYLLGLAQAKAA